MEEIFKDIPGYEGLYKISNKGNVKSICKRRKYQFKERLIKHVRSYRGYIVVNLCKNNKTQTLFIHRLVAQCFIPNPENKEMVNHIDGDKTNYSIVNLEWCSASENTEHAIKNKLLVVKKGEKHHCSKFSNTDVRLMRFLKDKLSISDIAYMFKSKYNTVYQILQNKVYINI